LGKSCVNEASIGEALAFLYTAPPLLKPQELIMRFLAPYQSTILSLVRIASAYMFILHGTTKAFGFPSAPQYPLEWMSIFGAAAALESSHDIGGTIKQVVTVITGIGTTSDELDQSFEKIHLQTDTIYTSLVDFSSMIEKTGDEAKTALMHFSTLE